MSINPTPPKLNAEEIHSLGYEARAKFGMKENSSILHRMRELGGKTLYSNVPAERTTFGITFRSYQDFDLHLYAHDSPERDHFKSAVCLGAICLFGKSGPFSIDFRSPEQKTDATSWLCLRFAFAFLMPDPEFKAAYEDLHGDLKEIARKFELSVREVGAWANILKLGETSPEPSL
ncbi:ImmA/IrrE family metallo-endopeptidase [Epibacterium sp. DP7N7-1]|nr:ImmA/IrrE family metallo-endopeptidase [Epibacterium sp. DP7N7-1]